MEKMKYGLVGVACLGLVACGGNQVKTEAVAQQLAPASAPEYNVGDKFVWNINGEQKTNVVASVADGNVTWKQGDNEVWTDQGPLVFPTKSWKSEDHGNGSLTISSVSGDLFPMTIGSKVSISAKGQGDKYKPWEDERTCTVESEERVTVPMGSFDTYKVNCKGNYINRTWYYSPELKAPVVYVRYHKRKHQTTLHELVGVERS
ncbi:hypothetical protein [Aliamphritea hakodatensis]|uniref:hypothetical protein n=1 Tax=Aliamphritea hakodatensis TaxID=2895352 RepID=UPI0022FD3B2C|nr:hypothetical protein [Aliamphritea hakodatensis]